MDGLKTVVLVIGVASAIIFPVQLVRMLRRRDRGRILEILVSAAALGVLYSSVFWPDAIHAAAPPVRWLAAAVMVLFTANIFGFAQWLFRPKAEAEPPAV